MRRICAVDGLADNPDEPMPSRVNAAEGNEVGICADADTPLRERNPTPDAIAYPIICRVFCAMEFAKLLSPELTPPTATFVAYVLFVPELV